MVDRELSREPECLKWSIFARWVSDPLSDMRTCEAWGHIAIDWFKTSSTLQSSLYVGPHRQKLLKHSYLRPGYSHPNLGYHEDKQKEGQCQGGQQEQGRKWKQGQAKTIQLWALSENWGPVLLSCPGMPISRIYQIGKWYFNKNISPKSPHNQKRHCS